MDVVLNRTNADLSVIETDNKAENAQFPMQLNSAEILMAPDYEGTIAEVRQLH